MGIHPDYPFAHLYRIENVYMPEEVLCFLWYLCSIYTIGITFDIQWLYQYINMQLTIFVGRFCQYDAVNTIFVGRYFPNGGKRTVVLTKSY